MNHIFKKERKLKTMNKPYTKLWLVAAMLGLMCPTFAQKYSIQLGAFTESIAPSFFGFSGFSDVKYQVSPQQFHQYTWGTFDDAKSAEEQLKVLRAQSPLHDLTNLKIIPQTTNEAFFSEDNLVSKIAVEPTGFQLFSRSIEFNRENLSLQKNDVGKLEEIRDILDKNPELKLRIIATGSANELSTQQQATAPNIIRNFLLANQIPAYRVKIIPNTIDKEQEIQKIAKTLSPVIMTLVDLKEEIVLDKFGADRLFVKELLDQKTNSVLE